MAGRTERSPRSQDGRAPSVLQRVVSTTRSPFGSAGPVQRAASEGDDRGWAQSGVRSSSLTATGRESVGREATARARFTTTCRSCGEILPTQMSECCGGCDGFHHVTCHRAVLVGETHTAFLCFICGARVLQWINIVEAMAVRHSQAWRKDAWWLTLVNAVANNLPLVDIGTLSEMS